MPRLYATEPRQWILVDESLGSVPLHNKHPDTAPMSRRFFFFPHGPERDPPSGLSVKSPPWRVPYAVRGALVSDAGSQLADGIIMGDGYQTRGGPVIVGGNQDPCVFSEPLGGLHSFCRVVKRRGRDNDVAELTSSGGLLPTVVAPGDVIFYGKPDLGGDVIAVDTVLVVERTEPFPGVVAGVGVQSDAYVFNLSDARAGGSHAGEDHQIVIVGHSEPTAEALDALATSFAPLADQDVDGRWRVLRIGRGDLAANYDALRRVFAETMFSGPAQLANKGRICELPAAGGEALARAVIRRSRNRSTSGAVFVLPVRPQGRSPGRLGSDGNVRAPQEHLDHLG
jgi:hypothetical protein